MADLAPGPTTSEFKLASIVTILQVIAGVVIFLKTGQVPPELLIGLGIPSAGYSWSRGKAKGGAAP